MYVFSANKLVKLTKSRNTWYERNKISLFIIKIHMFIIIIIIIIIIMRKLCLKLNNVEIFT
jgi:hypothetical protein